MRKFKLFLLALTGAAILMLGGCKEKQTYDEAAFENDMEPLTDDELKAMDEDSDDEMILQRKTAQKVQITLQKTKWMKKERIRTKMMLPSIFMSMAMRRRI